MRNVLVLVAHPDDEVLGCGGALAAQHAEDAVSVLVLANGETSGNRDQATLVSALNESRQAMARAAAPVLGIQTLEFLGFPDQQLDRVPLLELIRAAEPIVSRVSPQVIYTHSQADLNLDHRITGQVALTLCRPTPHSTVEEFYAFEVPASGWGMGQLGRPFAPNVFVDVEQTLERKLKALACYESEEQLPPHPHSTQMIRAHAARWGSLAGVASAEAFELVRSVRRGPA